MPNSSHITMARTASKGRQPTISQVFSQVSTKIGEEFFESLVKNLAEALEADCVYLGEFVGGQNERLRTLAAVLDGEPNCNADYVLAGSVAALVATGDSWSCTRGARSRFPSDELLAKIGAQACIAVPLLNNSRQTLGVLLAAFRRPLTNTRLPKSILETFAPRAAAELQRKQADEALRESEQRYHAFISQSIDAIWRIEFENPIGTDLSEDEQIDSIYRYGYLAECNDSMARLLGYDKASQLIGTGFEELARRADPRIREDLRSAIRSGYRFDTIETKPLDRDGNARHLLRSHWCIVENNKLLRIWGTHRDITELKRVEEALQTSECRLSELLESIHLLTLMLDGEGSITFCNDYMLRLTGWDAAELAGKSWVDLMVPPEEREKLRAEFASARAKPPAPRRFESTLVGKDGRRRLIAWESTILSDSAGGINGFVGVGRDITGVKTFQEELFQCRKLESIRHSVNKVVHDFSSLLTVISGHCALLLQDRPETDPAFVSLMEIKEAAERGFALAEQLVAFSTQQNLHPEVLNLNTLVAEVGPTVQLRLPENVTLHMELDPALAAVRVDAIRFRQALLNLAENAIEAMPEGGRLTIHSSNIEVDDDIASRLPGIAPGRYVLLAVADTGHGITPDAQEHLFEPFFSTKSSRSGMGLSSVYGIVRQSGGQVVVNTEPGIGTTFQIYLPTA